MDAHAELDASLGRQVGVALDHAALHLEGATHRVDDAAKLDEAAITGPPHDAAMVRGDRGIDQIAAQPPQPRQGAILICPGEPAVSDDVGNQDRGDFPGLAHGAPQAGRTLAQRPAATAPSGHDPLAAGRSTEV